MKLRTSSAIALAAAFAGAALVLTGCSTPEPLRTKADYKEFTDATWVPEHTVRAPYRTQEIEVNAIAALTEGIYAYFDTHRSIFRISQSAPGLWNVSETLEAAGERAFAWGAGAATLYRSANPVPNSGQMTAEELGDGRILIRNTGEAPFNMAIALRAFDISGKPIRHFLRNNNNQPDELAWFMSPEAKFPDGSVAYITTYWLGDDEIVQPSVSAFTGASTLEKLVAQFSTRSPFCLSYVNHVGATPYGVLFDRPLKKGSRRAKLDKGTFSLVAVNSRSIFCEPVEQGRKESGSWSITHIQGTRVLELQPNPDVASSDLGIQPINQHSIGVGFAEVMRPGASSTKLTVVPVRIIRNNMPVVDFRLKFNPAAGEAIRTVLLQADAARTAYKAQEKARIKAELEASRRQSPAQQPVESAAPLQLPSGNVRESSSPYPSASDPMGEFLRSK